MAPEGMPAAKRFAHRAAKARVENRIEPRGFGNPRIVRGRDDLVDVLFEDARSDDEIGDLALLANFPVDELFDVGVVGVEHDHLGRAPRRAARFDRAGGAIEDAEGTTSGRSSRAAAGELLARGAKSWRSWPRCPMPPLKMRASRITPSKMPPSFTRSSSIAEDVARRDLRVLEGVGRGLRLPVAGSTK